MNDKIKHVAVYLRLSRDEENQGIEKMLASHRKTLTDLCKKNGWSYEKFEEIASSSTIEHREKMVELLKRIELKEFDAVVVKDIDRLSRSEYDSSDIRRLLFKTGTSIVTPSKSYDLSKDDDNLLLGIQSLISSQEYKLILRRMKDGKLFATHQGIWMNGNPPIGYSKNHRTKKLEPNEKANLVRFIFDSIIEGKTVSDVVHELNTMGAKTRDGYDFHNSAIKRIVNNEVYKGMIIGNHSDGHNKKVKPKEEWIIAENAHEAIIDEETWEKANKIINTYKFARKRSDVKTYPTSKLIYCRNCQKIQGVQRKHTGRLYIKVCSRCLNRAHKYLPVLELIKNEVKKYRKSVLNTIATVKDNNANNEHIYNRKKQIQKQIRKATRAIGQIDILFEEMEIDLKDYRDRKNKRTKEIEMLKQELEKIENEDPKDKIADLKELKTRIDYLLQNWQCLEGEGLSDEDVNRSLHYIIDRIEWHYPKGSDKEPELKIIYK